MPLRWMLNVKGDHPEKLPALDTTGGLRPVAVPPFTDARNNPRKIGEDPDPKPPLPVYTDDDVPKFVHDAVSAQLRTAGIDVAETDADRTLKIQLLQFWTTGHRSYRADVRLRCSLVDEAGRELWSGLVGGVGENYGRAHSPANYNETLSNAVFDATATLLSQPGFLEALRK